MSGADFAHRDHVSQLYRTHYLWLHARLCRYLDSSSYAEDIAADTFAQLLSAPQSLVIREPRALLTTIARRLIFQLWRRRDVERAYLMSVQQQEPLHSPSPETLAQALQALQVIDARLDGLPDKVKQNEGAMTPEEVALYTVRALEKNKAIIIPGRRNRWITRIPRVLSRWMTRKIAAGINKSYCPR